MNHISVFFNSRIASDPSHATFARRLNTCSDCILTPFRYLLRGRKVTVEVNVESISVKSIEDYEKAHRTEKDFFLTILAIISLPLVLILGSIFKGMSYLSSEIRRNHHATVRHYTPMELTIGEGNGLLEEKDIAEAILKESKGNTYNQPISNLIVYTLNNSGFTIDMATVIFELNPQKLIFIGGGQFQDEALERFPDDWVKSKPKKNTTTSLTSAPLFNLLLLGFGHRERIPMAIQMEATLEKARRDLPDRISLLSSKRFKKIYLVNP